MTTKRRRRAKGPQRLPSRLELLQYYVYDPITGVLLLSRNNKPVGFKSNGYLRVTYKGKQYPAHRLIYKMYYGRDPGNKHIDHCNGDRSDNRISNLRCVSAKVNAANTSKARKDGIPQDLFVPNYPKAAEEFEKAIEDAVLAY